MGSRLARPSQPITPATSITKTTRTEAVRDATTDLMFRLLHLAASLDYRARLGDAGEAYWEAAGPSLHGVDSSPLLCGQDGLSVCWTMVLPATSRASHLMLCSETQDMLYLGARNRDAHPAVAHLPPDPLFL